MEDLVEKHGLLIVRDGAIGEVKILHVLDRLGYILKYCISTPQKRLDSMTGGGSLFCLTNRKGDAACACIQSVMASHSLSYS